MVRSTGFLPPLLLEITELMATLRGKTGASNAWANCGEKRDPVYHSMGRKAVV